MNTRQYLWAIAISVLLMAGIIELVRRRKLRPEFSVLWIATGLSIVVLAIWFEPLIWLTRLLGIELPGNALLLFGILFLLVLNIFLSTKISQLIDRQRRLMQELALIKEKIESDEQNSAD